MIKSIDGKSTLTPLAILKNTGSYPLPAPESREKSLFYFFFRQVSISNWKMKFKMSNVFSLGSLVIAFSSSVILHLCVPTIT